MAAKRGSESQLNHENWDQEDEPQEQGVFKKVSQGKYSHSEHKNRARRLQNVGRKYLIHNEQYELR